MIISQPALLCLTSFWNNLTGRATAGDVHAETAAKPAAPPVAAIERAAAIRDERHTRVTPVSPAQEALVTATHRIEVAQASHVGETAPTAAPLPQSAPSGASPLTANERRARAAALRALAFSRARRFDAAQSAFQDAATLDPALDLTRVPAFWSLERSAHEAAIAAYVAAGRSGDAAVLRAKVQSVYRPKPLRTRNVPATT